jgi:hypothetical protein
VNGLHRLLHRPADNIRVRVNHKKALVKEIYFLLVVPCLTGNLEFVGKKQSISINPLTSVQGVFWLPCGAWELNYTASQYKPEKQKEK